MKASKLRLIIPVAVMAIVAFGFATHTGFGTISAFGWQDISLLCPLGALSTMIASKTLIPRALASLGIAVLAILLLGRAFCGWACPVPLVSKLREAFAGRKKEALPEQSAAEASPGAEAAPDTSEAGNGTVAPLTEEELAALKTCGKGHSHGGHALHTCASRKGAIDTRHFVLGGSLLSAAIFGFPVFCLICPIGLTFATILIIMLLFTQGDVTWAAVAVPALLVVEVVFFRKWCDKICPLGAFMSLIGKLNRTLQPHINESACIEASKGGTCERCTAACPEGINLRHTELGNSMSECTRCGECVDTCPSQAIRMPLLPKKAQVGAAKLPDSAK